ncbi:MAG TPA: lipopolysaccharide biosynthesis protein, partial [Calditrichia bacterium]|nr:lipopolysaccharide biosynthesis protein [Calditrichia bacterium]
MSNAKIGKLARTGAMWTTGTNIGFWVVFTITSMVLARYLSPEEFGLMALANLTLVFVHTLLEFGLSYAFIQEKEVDQTDASTFFYLQVGINILIWLGISLSAPFVAAYYQQPVLKTLLPIFGFGYVLDALSQVPMTMMARELNYKRNSLVRFAAAVVGSAVCIVMAVLGFGIWSMVADYLVNVGTVLLIVMFWYDWRPSLIFRMNSARRLLNFGKWMLLKSLLRYVAKNLDYILVSRILGLGALGYYERAFNLMRTPQRLISNAVGGVLFSSFSRIQEEHERLRLAFRKVMLTIAVVSYPILVGMMLLTEEFILVIYGDAWTATITPLRIMCLAGIFVSFDPLLSSVLTSAGFVKYSAYRQIFEVALLAVACYIGSFWGITGVAWATVVLSVAVVLIMMQLLKKMSRIGWR